MPAGTAGQREKGVGDVTLSGGARHYRHYRRGDDSVECPRTKAIGSRNMKTKLLPPAASFR